MINDTSLMIHDLLEFSKEREDLPIGTSELLEEYSDLPHFTIFPNKKLWSSLKNNFKTRNSETNEKILQPYVYDVKEGKNHPIYTAHSYHAKVPHQAIMRYILHYTEPGDIIFDGFCGTGMTGVASQLLASPDQKFKEKVEKEMVSAKWGRRAAILSDLSPSATFIAYNLNNPIDESIYNKEMKRIIDEIENEFSWMYETPHTSNSTTKLITPLFSGDEKTITGKISYIVWSDVFICTNCSGEIIYWDIGVDFINKKSLKQFSCPLCDSKLNKRNLQRASTSKFDKLLNESITIAKIVPTYIVYEYQSKRYTKRPSKRDLRLIEKIAKIDFTNWIPITKLKEGYNTNQPKKSHGFNYIHQLYTKKNLLILSELLAKIKKSSTSKRIKSAMILTFTSIAIRNSTLFNKFVINRHNPRGRIGGPLTGTLYIPSLICEQNLIDLLKSKFRNFVKAFKYLPKNNSSFIQTASCHQTWLPKNSIDYIFTDPPFGDNLMYSELNLLFESWLEIFTNNKFEAIINEFQNKDRYKYQNLMEMCFKEAFRILKPGKWITVEFNNSKNYIWIAIQEALQRSGFIIADVRILSKVHGGIKAMSYTMPTKQDLVISAYKPSDTLNSSFVLNAGTEKGVWSFINHHLKFLPIFSIRNKKLEIISERLNYSLYDRMVSFHVQNGIRVPISAGEFYLGLNQRFPERDEMYFLSEQVNAYEKSKLKYKEIEQLKLLVVDEKSAILWLKNELKHHPQSYQEIQPKFMKNLVNKLEHEMLPELLSILEENFLIDEQDRWYVPDPNKQADLEKIRERGLIKEFQTYISSKGKLNQFRIEAVRAGFKKAWFEQDYDLIVTIGDRLPSSILQEDDSLLMYYDNASIRMGK